MAEFKAVFSKGAMFASGLSVDYGASMLVPKPGDLKMQRDGSGIDAEMNEGHLVIGKPDSASKIGLGMRIPSFQALNQSDARPWQFAHFLISDGRFRIILFAGNIENQDQKQ